MNRPETFSLLLLLVFSAYAWPQTEVATVFGTVPPENLDLFERRGIHGALPQAALANLAYLPDKTKALPMPSNVTAHPNVINTAQTLAIQRFVKGKAHDRCFPSALPRIAARVSLQWLELTVEGG